jgi:peptidoglycan/xylan/chitin deacetylase (PgdA/CDA1 family)
MSCASKPVRTTPPPIEEPPIELAIQKIKQDSPDIKKYYLTDDEGNIIVKAEFTETRPDTGKSEQFEVVYDIKNMQIGESGAYLTPFIVKSLDDDTVREDIFLWKPQKGIAGVLLAFDDDYIDMWEKYFDLFDSFNARVTFFVQGQYSSFCTAAYNRGHDIGYHTLNHLNLRNVSREVFDRETLSQVEVFRNAGLPLESFAYPFGFSDQWMHEELLNHYKILRNYGVRFRIYDRPTIQKGVISSMAIDNTVLKQDEDFYTTINLSLRTVKFLGGDYILPLTTHAISDTADWGIKPYRLEYLLQTVRDLRLNFYRYRDLAGNAE